LFGTKKGEGGSGGYFTRQFENSDTERNQRKTNSQYLPFGNLENAHMLHEADGKALAAPLVSIG
jgi:hypothetical protein